MKTYSDKKHVKDLPPGHYTCATVSSRLIIKEEGRLFETTIKPEVVGYYGSLTTYMQLPTEE